MQTLNLQDINDNLLQKIKNKSIALEIDDNYSIINYYKNSMINNGPLLLTKDNQNRNIPKF